MFFKRFLLSFIVIFPQICSASVHEFMNVPQDLDGGRGINIAVVEHGFNPELFESDNVQDCIDPNVGQQRIEENVKTLVDKALTDLKNEPYGQDGWKQAPITLAQPFLHLPDVVIGLGVAYSQQGLFQCMACETLQSEFLVNPFIQRQGSFQIEDPYGIGTQGTLKDFLREIFDFSEERCNAQLAPHGNQVISCIQSIAPSSSIRVYHPRQLQEVAENDEIQVVTVSTFDMMGTDEIIEKFSIFGGTGKIITVALDNATQDSTKISAYSELCQYARDSGFYVILCGSSSLKTYEMGGEEHYYLGNLSYISQDSQDAFSGHYVTAPGYRIPYQDGIISGNSFATPHVAGILVKYLSENPDVGLEALFTAVVSSGRTRPEELMNISSDDLEEEFLSAIEQKYPEKYIELIGDENEEDTLENAKLFFKEILEGYKDAQDLLLRGFVGNLTSLQEERQFHILNSFGDLRIFNKYWNHVDYGRLVETLQ